MCLEGKKPAAVDVFRRLQCYERVVPRSQRPPLSAPSSRHIARVGTWVVCVPALEEGGVVWLPMEYRADNREERSASMYSLPLEA